MRIIFSGEDFRILKKDTSKFSVLQHKCKYEDLETSTPTTHYQIYSWDIPIECIYCRCLFSQQAIDIYKLVQFFLGSYTVYQMFNIDKLKYLNATRAIPYISKRSY